jgi:hypothetical protein
MPIFSGVKSALNREFPYYDAVLAESLIVLLPVLLKTWPGAGMISIIVFGTSKPNYFYLPPITILVATP